MSHLDFPALIDVFPAPALREFITEHGVMPPLLDAFSSASIGLFMR
jgi:hypothetical protein